MFIIPLVLIFIQIVLYLEDVTQTIKLFFTMNDYNIIKTLDGSYSLNNKIFEEDYHSSLGAKTEAKKLYIEGSAYEQELEKTSTNNCVYVLDIGLGLGYNAFSTIESWEKSTGLKNLKLFSLENDPILFEKLQSREALWKQNWKPSWKMYSSNISKESQSLYTKTFKHPLSNKNCQWTILLADALDSIKQLEKKNISWNYIWQDPFSPKKNPELWSTKWFTDLALQANQQTVLMTYSVARATKEALKESGWSIEKIATPGHKKAWLKAVKTL